MALFENFPYTNLHELNLDWLIQSMKELEEKVQDGPVFSVNGETGEVILYKQAFVQFPAINDPNTTVWNIFRYLNNHIYGIQFDSAGNVYAMHDAARHKLLTFADIPPEAGVISVNGKYGVVHLYGSDIQTAGDDPKTVQESIYDLEDWTVEADDLFATLQAISSSIKNCVAYVENTNTATHNIPVNSYVIWNNNPYKASLAIAVGDPLSSTNLTAVSAGGFVNALRQEIATLNSNLALLGNLYVKNVTTTTANEDIIVNYGYGSNIIPLYAIETANYKYVPFEFIKEYSSSTYFRFSSPNSYRIYFLAYGSPTSV